MKASEEQRELSNQREEAKQNVKKLKFDLFK
jgi:hypothetical protein